MFASELVVALYAGAAVVVAVGGGDDVAAAAAVEAVGWRLLPVVGGVVPLFV